jgi:hypothetical protein
MACSKDHAQCIFCGRCLTCSPHGPHTDAKGNPKK